MAVRITQSAEDYLETILILSKTLSKVRAIDIARELGFSRASVSISMKNLRENGSITVDENGSILLTESGFKTATDVYERHLTLACALMSLGVDELTAHNDACRIEHVISADSFERIKKHLNKVCK